MVGPSSRYLLQFHMNELLRFIEEEAASGEKAFPPWAELFVDPGGVREFHCHIQLPLRRMPRPSRPPCPVGVRLSRPPPGVLFGELGPGERRNIEPKRLPPCPEASRLRGTCRVGSSVRLPCPARSVKLTLERMPPPNLLPPWRLALRLVVLLEPGDPLGLCTQSHIENEPFLGRLPPTGSASFDAMTCGVRGCRASWFAQKGKARG